MRIVEDIVCVEKKGKGDLLKNRNSAKKAAVSSRFKNKTPVKKTKEKITKASGLESLIILNKRLIFGITVVLFVFIGLFLYNSDKNIPISVENIAAELEKENKLLEKEISEIENSNDALRNINQRIEQLGS